MHYASDAGETGKWLHAQGSPKPFQKWSPKVFLNKFRFLLRRVGVLAPQRYDTKAFRRGLAQDVCDAKGNLASVLAAGEWSSSRFKAYIDMQKVGNEAVSEAFASVPTAFHASHIAPPTAKRKRTLRFVH